MRIYREMKTNNKTQSFGANYPCVIKDKRPFQFVTCGTPNSHKLYTDELNMKGHSGEDWETYYKEPLYFPVNALGIEWEADSHVDSGGAVVVVVRSTTAVPFSQIPEHVGGSLNMIKKQYNQYGGLYLQFWYVHLQGTHINGKVPVKFGDFLGYADSSGASSGNHCHKSMKVSDPNSWFYIDGDNGYQGAIDMDKYFSNKYVLDVLKIQSTSTVSLQLTVIKLATQVISLYRKLISLNVKKNSVES